VSRGQPGVCFGTAGGVCTVVSTMLAAIFAIIFIYGGILYWLLMINMGMYAVALFVVVFLFLGLGGIEGITAILQKGKRK
jgi:hypothetical protein